MPQHDMILDNAAGAAFRADANDALAALVANSSGATEPATKYAYQWWADTTTGLLKIRNAANNAWVTVGTLATAGLGLAVTMLAEQASTSGTALDFTGIPSGAKRISIMFVGVSTSGTDNWLIQIGDAGGIETSGYLGAGGVLSATPSVTNFTTGFGMPSSSAATVAHGTITLDLEDSTGFTWVASGDLGLSNGAAMLSTSGSKSLSAVLDRVRITTTGGTDTFDAGSINVSYQ